MARGSQNEVPSPAGPEKNEEQNQGKALKKELWEEEIKYKTDTYEDTKEEMEKKLEKIKNNQACQRFRDYRKPQVREQEVIDIRQLDNPPKEFYNEYLWLADSKYPSADVGLMLLDFYLWGINHRFPKNHVSRAKVFIKLFYNMDERYRVKTKDQFENINRDAGPRLLKKEVLERLRKQPISRDYPEIPNSDDWEEQRLFPFRKSPAQEREEQRRAQDNVVPQVPEEIPENLDVFRETLERLLIWARYKDLEVDRSIEKSQIWAGTLKLLEGPDHAFELNDEGTSYPLGYGPSKSEGDTGLNLACDCMMMAGKFLDAGITNIDMKEIASGELQITRMHQHLTNAVGMNWGSFNGESTVQQRRNFHANFLRNDYKDIRSIHDLIENSTLLRKQFEFTSEEAEFCEDGHKKVIRQPTFLRHKYLPTQAGKVDMRDLLQEAFDPGSPEPSPSTEQHQDPRHTSYVQPNGNESQPTCSVKDCRKPVCNSRVCHTMPLRLAIFLEQDMVPENHTGVDIEFTITNSNGEKELVVYRWLGGIYSDSKSLNEPGTSPRVYWTDDTRGEKKARGIRMYDPLNGWYIGGIMPASDGSLIPRKWKPSVIFYESILNPNPLDITVLTAILGDIGHAVHTGKRILQVHQPWSSRAEKKDPVQISSGPFDNDNTINIGNIHNLNELPSVFNEDFTGIIAPNFGNGGGISHEFDLNQMEANPSPSDWNTSNQAGHSNTGSFAAHNITYNYPNVPQQAPQNVAVTSPTTAQVSTSAMTSFHGFPPSVGSSNISGLPPSVGRMNLPMANGYNRMQAHNPRINGTNGFNGSTPGLSNQTYVPQNGNQGIPYAPMPTNGNGYPGMQHFVGNQFGLQAEDSAALGQQPVRNNQQASGMNVPYGNNLPSAPALVLDFGESPKRKRTGSAGNNARGKRRRGN